MTALLELEDQLARLMEELDQALELGEPAPALVEATHQAALATREKRDSCALFLDMLERADQGLAAQIEHLKHRRDVLAKRKAWMDNIIITACRNHAASSGEPEIRGECRKFRAIQNPDRVEPVEMATEEMRENYAQFVREKRSYEWDKPKLRAALEAGTPNVPAEIRPGAWRLKIT